MDQPLAATLQRQISELVAIVGRNSEEIDSLTASAAAAHDRADAAETRASAAHLLADRIERRLQVDEELIQALQAEGVVAREDIARLQQAIAVARTIGTAVGIIMGARHIGEKEALLVIEGAAERTHMSVDRFAATIIEGAEELT